MENKKNVIVITGISSGIGETLAKKVLDTGLYHVVGIGRSDNKDLLTFENYDFYEMDLCEHRMISEVVEKIFRKHRHIDVLVNNAGFGYIGTVDDINEHEIRKQMEVNFFAPLLLSKETLIYMKKQESGHIISISSIATVVNTPTLGIYAASKSALKKTMDILRNEVKGGNIKISMVSPGAVKTGFGKNMKKCKEFNNTSNIYEEWARRFKNYFKLYNTSDEVAKEVMRLISNEKEFTNKYISTRELLMDLLNRMLPTTAFEYLVRKVFYPL